MTSQPSTHRVSGFLAVCCLLALGGCASLGPGDTNTGKASYYHDRHQGMRTASGEPYNRQALTAAHRTLPFGSQVRVTNLNNSRSVVVRVNDRGPFVRGRIIDVSRAAAERLDMLRAGVVPVRIEVLR